MGHEQGSPVGPAGSAQENNGNLTGPFMYKSFFKQFRL